MKRVLVVLASVIGLIAASAAAVIAEGDWILAQTVVGDHDPTRPNLGHFGVTVGVEYAISAACASVVAGVIIAVLLTSRLPRTLLVVLGLFSAAMLATSEYVRHRPSLAPK